MNNVTTWNYPTNIKFGIGAINLIATECKYLNLKNPLVITDSGLFKQDFFQEILQTLKNKNIKFACFYDIKPNPTKLNIGNGCQKFTDGMHDGVIAIGGGSALDAGKTIAFLSKQNKDLWEFEDIGDNYLKANPQKIAKIIAIPTTAGTGSEVGRASVILDEEKKIKRIIFHPQMLPKIVIADPNLTVNLPKHLTAATGIDALIHNLEAYFAPSYHPMADGIALNGIKLINESLVKAFINPEDIDARKNMLAASIMGATAFQKGLGAIHSLSHAIGATYDTHHGLLNAILTPYVISYNNNALKDKVSTLASFLNLKENNFQGFINWINNLLKKLEIPNSLKNINIDTSNTKKIIDLAINDPTFATNPGNLNKQDLEQIFINAVNGNING